MGFEPTYACLQSKCFPIRPHPQVEQVDWFLPPRPSQSYHCSTPFKPTAGLRLLPFAREGPACIESVNLAYRSFLPCSQQMYGLLFCGVGKNRTFAVRFYRPASYPVCLRHTTPFITLPDLGQTPVRLFNWERSYDSNVVSGL